MNLKQIKEERFEEDSLEPKMVDQREVFQNKIRLMQYKCVKTKGWTHRLKRPIGNSSTSSMKSPKRTTLRCRTFLKRPIWTLLFGKKNPFLKPILSPNKKKPNLLPSSLPSSQRLPLMTAS